MAKMPLMEDRIKAGRFYGMTIGGKLIVAKVIQIYPLDIGVRKNPVKENVVRWDFGLIQQLEGFPVPVPLELAHADRHCTILNRAFQAGWGRDRAGARSPRRRQGRTGD